MEDKTVATLRFQSQWVCLKMGYTHIKIWGTSMPLPRDLDAEQGTLKQKWEGTAPQTAK
jgi:hypothetical protein